MREAFPATDPVTLDLEDVPVTALLHHLLVAWRSDENTWPGARASVGFENWTDTSQEYNDLDEVAKDRAAAAAS